MESQSTTLTAASWRNTPLLTVHEIALWARVHPKTVYRWIAAGRLHAIQFGRRTYRVPEPVVVEFLNKIGYSYLVRPGKGDREADT
jgi:excisionase family DNA binding protein